MFSICQEGDQIEDTGGEPAGSGITRLPWLTLGGLQYEGLYGRKRFTVAGCGRRQTGKQFLQTSDVYPGFQGCG